MCLSSLTTSIASFSQFFQYIWSSNTKLKSRLLSWGRPILSDDVNAGVQNWKAILKRVEEIDHKVVKKGGIDLWHAVYGCLPAQFRDAALRYDYALLNLDQLDNMHKRILSSTLGAILTAHNWDL